MDFAWIVVLPPIFVVVWAMLTKRLLSALLVGTVSASLICNKFDLVKSVQMIANRFVVATEFDKLISVDLFWTSYYPFICLFLILLGILIVLIDRSGGAYAYSNFISKKMHSAAAAEKSSLILSLFFFIDDYFSCLTVGAVVKPIAECFKVPKAKFALLVNSMAAPLVVLFPISSWACAIVTQLKQAGISTDVAGGSLVAADAFYVYLKGLPFLFYSFIVIPSVWYLVQKRLSFGILYQQEKEAEATGNLLGGKVDLSGKDRGVSDNNKHDAILLDFILPIGVLCLSVFLLIFYFGDFFLFGGVNGFMDAIKQANMGVVLFGGSVVALVVSTIYFLLRRRFGIGEIPSIFKEGFDMMGGTLFVLLLIWTFTAILKKDLQTGQYLASLVVGKLSIQLMPAAFFAIAVSLAMLIGSAWGTFGVLLPLAVPMLISMLGMTQPVAIEQVLILFPLVGAIVSGAIVGNHLSPLSDNMLMAAKSTGAYHIDVVRAQRSITLPTAVSVFLAFALSGFLILKVGLFFSALISAVAGIALNLVVLQFLDLLQHRKFVKS